MSMKEWAIKREYAVGDTVQMGLLTLVCEEGVNQCEGCVYFDGKFRTEPCCHVKIGDCEKSLRTDNKDVIFKLKDD